MATFVTNGLLVTPKLPFYQIFSIFPTIMVKPLKSNENYFRTRFGYVLHTIQCGASTKSQHVSDLDAKGGARTPTWGGANKKLFIFTNFLLCERLVSKLS